MAIQIDYKLTQRQTEAFNHLTNDETLALLFGGAKGGGKSYLFCLWAWHWAIYLISFFGIKDVRHPVPVGFIGRKRAIDFNDTTLETFKKIIPVQTYDIKPQDKEIIIDGKVKICFGGLDDEANIQKFNSAEYAFLGIDQAEETTRQDVAVLQATLRLRYNHKTPPYKELYTANPAEGWLKEDFILRNRNSGIYVPALPDDNPYLPENYKETLRSAFAYDPSLLRAYLDGDWDAFANLENQLVNANHVNNCRKNLLNESEEDEIKIIASDVATKHGEALTVIIYRYGHTIRQIDCYKQIPATMTAQHIKQAYEKRKATTCVVDSDGFGEGVSDILIGQNVYPTEFHGGYGSEAIDSRRFRNLRSQFYFIVAKKLEKGLYDLSYLPQNIYEQLKGQLCAIKIRKPDAEGRMQIETKEDMAARQVKSPDLADAFVYSEYGYWMATMADLKAHSWR